MQNINYKLISLILLVIMLIGLVFLLQDANSTLNRAQSAIDKIAHDRKVAMDSVRVLNRMNDSLNQSITVYKDSITALSKYKSKVIIKYRDQKNFVSDASIAQLDSIIRANIRVEQ